MGSRDYNTNRVEVWDQFRHGSKRALETIYHDFYDDLYRYALKFCGSETMAKDQIQKLFLKLWQNRKQLERVQNVKTYLWTAVRRGIINEMDRNESRRERETRFAEYRPVMQFSVEEIIIHKQDHARLQHDLKEAFDELSSRQREIIYLKYYEGMSYAEIEKITSLSYQTIRNYVYKGMKKLRRVLDEDYNHISIELPIEK